MIRVITTKRLTGLQHQLKSAEANIRSLVRKSRADDKLVFEINAENRRLYAELRKLKQHQETLGK